MKKIFLFTLSLFLFSNIDAQNKLSLELKDGTVINGFGRIKINETILYRKTKDAEKEIYDYKTVKKMIIYSDDLKQEYEYKIVEESGGVGSVKLIEILIVGKVNLYQDYTSGMSYGPNMIGGYGFTSSSKTTYYISKSQEDIVSNLRIGNTYSKRFKKTAKKYFSSCPDLLEKISTKFFKRYGIRSVVEFYNEKCN